MQLTRPTGNRATISLVPLVDVMLILLIFFMVTSTYLNLDMVPVVDRAEATPAAPPPGGREGGSTMLLRLGADGLVRYRAELFEPAAAQAVIAARLDRAPDVAVVVLPSGGASMQALVTLMEAAAAAGADNLKVMRLEARP